MPIRIGFPEGFGFTPLPIYSQDSKKQFIEKLLKSGLRIKLSDNLMLDSLYNFHIGKFSEGIILVNISLEIFVEEFMTEKYLSEGNNKDKANELVNKLFHGNFHATFRKAFFNQLNENKRKRHLIWIKFENIRAKRKQVMHPHTRKVDPPEAYEVFLDVVAIREWIIRLKPFVNGDADLETKST